MARVTGPLHSDDAHGLYGGDASGVIYFANGRKRYTRSLIIDVAQPLTVPKVAVQANLRCLAVIWQGFSTPEKAYWASYGAEFGIQAYPAFVRYNRLQMSQGWAPQLEMNAQHLGVPAPPTVLAAAVVMNKLHITWTDGTLSYTSLICAGMTAGFEPVMGEAVYQCPATDGEDRQATVALIAGTYYLKAMSGDEDGGVGAPGTSVGPLVIA